MEIQFSCRIFSYGPEAESEFVEIVMSARQNASLGVANSTLAPPITTSSTDQKIEFYHTYDPMTGIRIAATLGGFFSLMVILIVYKSKSKTEKALENPVLAAAAVAEAEEEEQRQIQAAIEATVFQELNPPRAAPRRSLDFGNSPAGWVRNTRRFSSVGGYSSLIEPPVRTHPRLPCFIDEDSPNEDDDLEDVTTYNSRYLDVPRRSSNITCSSSDSSYLERRGSSVILGLPIISGHKSSGKRRPSSPLPEQYDYYYPIDIRVIQPTPGGSPCGSERALHDNARAEAYKNCLTGNNRRAPLASISSCNSSLGAEGLDLEMQSLTSDSVFQEDDCPDTEDEVDPFSTDSEASDESAWCRKALKLGESLQRRYSKKSSIKNRRVSVPCISENTVAILDKNRASDQTGEFRPSTSDFRSPQIATNNSNFRSTISEFKMSVSEHDFNCSEKTPFIKNESLSESSLHCNLAEGADEGALNLPATSEKKEKSLDSLTLIGSRGGSTVTLPTLPLFERSPSTNTLKKEEGSWSQETLF